MFETAETSGSVIGGTAQERRAAGLGLRPSLGKVPTRYSSYEDFKKELDAFEFTVAEPSVLARLAYIEQFLIKQQQAGVFREL